MMLEAIRMPADRPLSSAADLARLNGVVVTVDQLASARAVLSDLADELGWDPAARRAALTAGLDATPTIIEAIDARLLGLRKWEDLRDPDRSRSQRHLMEAAALAPLVDSDHGTGFDDDAFRELADFIAELPW